MPTGTIESAVDPQPTTLIDCLTDATRRTAHLSHEAQLLQSIASDAVDDGVYAARRALKNAKRRVVSIADFKDELALRIKRQPMRSMALAAAVGLAVGVVATSLCRAGARRMEGGC